MQVYLDFLREILTHGQDRADRTGVGVRSLFGQRMRFDLTNSQYPLLTTKKLHFKSIVCELLWFLRGETTLNYLHQNNITIWDEWADAAGNLGPIYGKQWRRWETASGEVIDQINTILTSLKNNPYSRRHIVSAWNVGELDQMALPPCHILFQFYISDNLIDNINNNKINNKKYLSCQIYQRSADAFLGVPFNIGSYALLTMLIAKILNFEPYELIWVGGDCHLYHNHLTQAELQLLRKPYPLPRLNILNFHPDKLIDQYDFADFELIDYNAHPKISAPIAV